MKSRPADDVVLEAWSRFRQRLGAFLLRRTGSHADAEDLLQSTLLKLHEHRHAIHPDRVAAWLFATARHALIDHRRRQARQRMQPDRMGGREDFTDPDGEASSLQALAACIRPFLAALPEADRRVLEQVELRGGSQTELARTLGLPLSTVKSRVQRARRKLRRLFEQCCELEFDARHVPHDCTPRGPDAALPCGSCETIAVQSAPGEPEGLQERTGGSRK